MDAKKILFADDDPEIREVLRLLLTGEGYTAVEAASGAELLEKLDDSVNLVKPFSYTELVSRVKAMLRRYCVYGAKSAEQGSVIRCCGNIEIDTAQSVVRRDGQEVALTDTEYRILLLLASHQKTVFSVQNIYESIWDEPYFYTSNNTVMVHIRNIRRKLGDGTAVRVRFFYYAGDAWFYSLLALSALTAFLAFSICFIGFAGRKLRYVSQLRSELDILAGGDLSYPVTVKGEDELSELASGIDQMRRSILSHQEAEEKMRSANSQLVTAMSHDLRTPLTSLLGYLELMERGKYENEEQLRHFIGRSLEKTLRIKEMADKLFEYFLVYSSEWEQPDLEPADADEVFRHFWSEYAFSLESSGFTVRTEFGHLGGQIRINIDLLRRAFDNLYSNLLKYADPGQEIAIVCTQEDGCAVLALANRISAQRSAKESTNIGLNTCRRILQYHGGSFSAEESDGVFRVKLSLPLAC